LFTGLVFAAGTLLLFYLNLSNPVKAHTIAFTTLVMLELFRVNVIRNHYGTKLFSNKYLILALLVSLLFQLAAIYTPLNKIFETVFLGVYDWILILIVCIIASGLSLIFYKLTVKATKEID